jgi:hypothetical protein
MTNLNPGVQINFIQNIKNSIKQAFLFLVPSEGNLPNHLFEVLIEWEINLNACFSKNPLLSPN